MSARHAIVTLCIGETAAKCAAISHPAIQAYAVRIGADFHVITERRWPDLHIHFEKFQMYDLVMGYERTLYLDSDVIVAPDAPNIFDVAPEGQLAFMNEREHFPDYSDFYENRVSVMREHVKRLGPGWVWPNSYFNAGVFLIEPRFAWILKDKPDWQPDGDQIYLNTLIVDNDLPVFRLPLAFNYMPFHLGGDLEKAYAGVYFVHAGHPDKVKCVEMMREIARRLGYEPV
jgi:lipopolysaccharide biosynthesis glycosyltransferase